MEKLSIEPQPLRHIVLDRPRPRRKHPPTRTKIHLLESQDAGFDAFFPKFVSAIDTLPSSKNRKLEKEAPISFPLSSPTNRDMKSVSQKPLNSKKNETSVTKGMTRKRTLKNKVKSLYNSRKRIEEESNGSPSNHSYDRNSEDCKITDDRLKNTSQVVVIQSDITDRKKGTLTKDIDISSKSQTPSMNSAGLESKSRISTQMDKGRKESSGAKMKGEVSRVVTEKGRRMRNMAKGLRKQISQYSPNFHKSLDIGDQDLYTTHCNESDSFSRKDENRLTEGSTMNRQKEKTSDLRLSSSSSKSESSHLNVADDDKSNIENNPDTIVYRSQNANNKAQGDTVRKTLYDKISSTQLNCQLSETEVLLRNSRKISIDTNKKDNRCVTMYDYVEYNDSTFQVPSSPIKSRRTSVEEIQQPASNHKDFQESVNYKADSTDSTFEEDIEFNDQCSEDDEINVLSHSISYDQYDDHIASNDSTLIKEDIDVEIRELYYQCTNSEVASNKSSYENICGYPVSSAQGLNSCEIIADGTLQKCMNYSGESCISVSQDSDSDRAINQNTSSITGISKSTFQDDESADESNDCVHPEIRECMAVCDLSSENGGTEVESSQIFSQKAPLKEESDTRVDSDDSIYELNSLPKKTKKYAKSSSSKRNRTKKLIEFRNSLTESCDLTNIDPGGNTKIRNSTLMKRRVVISKGRKVPPPKPPRKNTKGIRLAYNDIVCTSSPINRVETNSCRSSYDNLQDLESIKNDETHIIKTPDLDESTGLISNNLEQEHLECIHDRLNPIGCLLEGIRDEELFSPHAGTFKKTGQREIVENIKDSQSSLFDPLFESKTIDLNLQPMKHPITTVTPTEGNSELESQEKCTKHEKPLSLYCVKCSSVICEQCRDVYHSQAVHKVLSTPDAQSVLRTKVASLMRHYSLLRSLFMTLKNVHAAYSRRYASMNQFCEQIFIKLHLNDDTYLEEVVKEAESIIKEGRSFVAMDMNIKAWESRQHKWGHIVHLAVRCHLLANKKSTNDMIYIRVKKMLLQIPWNQLHHIVQPYHDHVADKRLEESKGDPQKSNPVNHVTGTAFDNVEGYSESSSAVTSTSDTQGRICKPKDQEQKTFPSDSSDVLLNSLLPYLIFNPHIRYFIRIHNWMNVDLALVLQPAEEHANLHLSRHLYTAAYSPSLLRRSNFTPSDDSLQIVEKQMMTGGLQKSRMMPHYTNSGSFPSVLDKVYFQDVKVVNGGLGLAAATGTIKEGDVIVDPIPLTGPTLAVVMNQVENESVLRFGRIVQGFKEFKCVIEREEKRKLEATGLRKIIASVKKEEEEMFHLTFGLDM